MASGVIKYPFPTEILLDIRDNPSDFDGVYFLNKSTYVNSIQQIRLARRGNVVSFSLRLTVQGPMSANGSTYGLCYIQEALWPAFPYRNSIFNLNNVGTRVGTLSFAASNGQISFAPATALASGSTLPIYIAVTYLTAQPATAAPSGSGSSSGGSSSSSGVSVTQVIEALYPVGSVYISMNSTMPSAIADVGTWQAITGDYVLRTITTGVGGTYANAGNTGSTTLTVNQIPSHTHGLNYGTGSAANGTGNAYNLYINGGSATTTQSRGGGQGHTHTAGMPKNVSIYMWKRTS